MSIAFGFDYPWILFSLAVFVPLAVFDFSGKLGKRERRLPEELRKKLMVSVIFFRIFIACVIIALAGPRWGTGPAPEEYRRGLDAVFAVDVSRSMEIKDAWDGEVSRLRRGLVIAREAAQAVPGPRYAAAFGMNRGLAAVPLTWDNEAVLSFLGSLDGSSLTGRGTNLESLIDAAVGVFQNSFPGRRVIILISDGEALSGVLKNALDRCVREGVMVNALAVGSDEGRPVPCASGDQSETISRRDSAAMRMAAERTGGIYIDASRDDAAGILAAHLRSLAPEAGGRGSRTGPKERRSLFIVIAILAYCASKLAPLIPRRNK
ncbi:MAG: VWA domain-containing protein [Treponema sp.]|nr:VWA domain-containing protein [Treponema sp.]